MGNEQKLKYCFIAYAILIVLLAIVPLGNSEQLNKIFIFHFRADHVLHATIFIPWAFFCVKMDKSLPVWLFLGILYAAFCEGIQLWIPYRSFNIKDLLFSFLC